MQQLTVALDPDVDPKRLWRKVAASDGDAVSVVSEPCRVYEGDELKLVYSHLGGGDLSGLRDAMRSLRYGVGYRSVGLKSRSRVVGFQPRLTIRRDFCCVAAAAKDYPGEHATIVGAAETAAREFEVQAPAKFEWQHMLLESKVKEGWRLPGGVWTSGICNKDNQLAYHFDAGNFKGSWSGMFVFHRDCEGGHLVLPQYHLSLAFPPSGALVLFDGQSVMHGVTPLKLKSSLGYRYSVVYYALQQMCHCLSPEEELERIRVKKTEREVKRAAVVHPGKRR